MPFFSFSPQLPMSMQKKNANKVANNLKSNLLPYVPTTRVEGSDSRSLFSILYISFAGSHYQSFNLFSIL